MKVAINSKIRAQNPFLNRVKGHWAAHHGLGFAWALLAVLALFIGTATVGISFHGYVPQENKIIALLAMFLFWRERRHFLDFALLMLLLFLLLISVASQKRDFILPGFTFGIAMVCGIVVLNAYRSARASFGLSSILRGRPFTLYLRSGMVDRGPFFGFESALEHELHPFGACVMLSISRVYQKSGIVRLPWWEWQNDVSELIRRAALVVVFLMPRTGDDKRAPDFLWDEFELDAMKEILPTGKLVIFFREGWANRGLPLINSSGTAHYGTTSLMGEVHRVMRNHVTCTWPENLEKARALWFSPGAKPQSLGVFPASLGERSRIRAELAPVFDYFRVGRKGPVMRIIAVVLIASLGVLTGSLIANSAAIIIRSHFIVFMAATIVLWITFAVVLVARMRHYYQWDNYEYTNFVLHRKYRR